MRTLFKEVFGNRGELVMVILTIGILIVLFTPIPSGMLDFLLLTNFSFGLMILLMTYYMDKPLSFSTFPSLLLIATLFRLSLNIAATRLILADADAGAVIGAIGSYVVGGNYVIGLVVFLILIVVQYVVVTNGAQRVAEVAARFTLDGMPGKQMSIDADLNMGLIDEKEAQTRRKNIEKEANFYGAMDGASKFVKGDAIAGILIILIDIIGGLTIGILQKGMPWGDAVFTYTLLTVGDGIVTQIPALIISTATGLIVTRAATDSNLGDEISRQLMIHPKTMVMLTAALLVALFLPGLPAFPIMILLCLAIGMSYLAFRKKAQAEESEAVASEEPEIDETDLYGMLTVEPIEILIGRDLVQLAGNDDGLLMDRVKAFRKQFAIEMGIVLPRVRLKDDKRLKGTQYAIHVFGAKVGEGEIIPDKTLAINPGGARTKLDGTHTKDPTYGLEATWIDDATRKAATTSGYTLVDPLTVLTTHFTELMRQSGSTLLTRGETEKLIERVREQQGSLLEELIPGVLSLGDVQKVLQMLLKEGVPIRNLEQILEVLVDQGKKTRAPEQLTEAVRQQLGPVICQGLSNKKGELYVMTLDPALEQLISESVRSVNERASLILEPGIADKFIRQLIANMEEMLGQNHLPVLMCAPVLRRHIKAFTERMMPHMAVISMTEVPNSIKLKSFGMVKV